MKLDEIGIWSEIKLDIIKEYANTFTTIMKSQGCAICQGSCRMKVIFISITIDYIHAAFNCRVFSLISFGGFSQTRSM